MVIAILPACTNDMGRRKTRKDIGKELELF
jgi:hypothetical protein